MKNFQEMVSLEKKRFKDDKYDLDLACNYTSYLYLKCQDITDRIIAMGFPSMGMEKVYRNPMSQVQKFFNEYHPNAHKVKILFMSYSFFAALALLHSQRPTYD